MSKYIVSIPITGFCAVEVEAADSKSAIAAAWKAIDDGDKGDVEWEYTEAVTTGNVCHAMQNNVEVTRLRDEDASLKGPVTNRYKNPPPQECARCHGMYPFLAMGICGDCCRGVAREARRPTSAPTKETP